MFRFKSSELPELQTLPVIENGKRCLIPSWSNLPSAELWEIKPDNHTNEGWRGGNGWAFLDCDSPETTWEISTFLDYMGLDATRVQTQSGNYHFWVMLADAPKHRSKTEFLTLDGHLGFGRGAFAVAPPSTVNDTDYVIKRNGTHEPAEITWDDLAPLVGFRPEPISTDNMEQLPVPVLYREPAAGHRMYALLEALSTAEQGQPIGRYASRSEAEAASMAYAILNGWQFRQWWQVFTSYNTKRAEKRSKRAYMNDWRRTVADIASNETRQQIAGIYGTVDQLGLKRQSDIKALKAVLSLAYRHDKLTVGTPSRDVALLGAMDPRTASRSLSRLTEMGYVMPDEGANSHGRGLSTVSDCVSRGSRVLCIAPMFSGSADIVSNGAESPPPCLPVDNLPNIVSNGAEAVHLSPAETEAVNQLWAKLGRGVAYRVYGLLSPTPTSINALVRELSGHKQSVRRSLNNLEALGMAERTNSGWVIGQTTPLSAAEMLGTSDDIAERRKRIRADRAIKARYLKSRNE